MITKETDLNRMEARLKVWADRIERLKTKLMTTHAETGTEYLAQLNQLAQQQAGLAQKLQELKQTKAEQRENIRADIQQAVTSMAENFDRVKERVNQLGRLGWAQGMAQHPEFDSEGWVEGMGHRTGHSEGWIEGMGEQLEDSNGWAEGMTTR